MEDSQTITREEALLFRALDAEIRNHILALRIADLEIEKMTYAWTEQINTKKREIDAIKKEKDRQKAEYIEFVKSLAEKHGLDPNRMMIDTELQTIRELPKE